MGHDIKIKKCGCEGESDGKGESKLKRKSTLKLKTNLCRTGKCDCHFVDNTYISGNFCVYAEYWDIRRAHGHTGYVISLQLEKAIKNLKAEGCTGEIKDGEDGWTMNKNVFLWHLEKIYELTVKYPYCIFTSDNVWTPFIEDENDE
jgi:hypothetical protein